MERKRVWKEDEIISTYGMKHNMYAFRSITFYCIKSDVIKEIDNMGDIYYSFIILWL